MSPAPILLGGPYQAVTQAESPEALRQEIVGFAQGLGFRTVSATVMIDRPGQRELISVDNTPAEFQDSFWDPALSQRDPVMQHCRFSSQPILWNAATYQDQGLGDLYDHQARWGYRAGICLAMHLPGGRHFIFGVDADDDLPQDPAERQRLVAATQLFATMAQETAFRLLLPLARVTRPILTDEPGLSPRELEALRWTMEGKTAWETGAILAISERTAAMHLQNAMRKLDCSNKLQAVVKAMRLGLLD